jgi:hypothetical protein
MRRQVMWRWRMKDLDSGTSCENSVALIPFSKPPALNWTGSGV